MFDLDKWREIWATLSRNKTRSLMTALGVSWGLFMFIILVGFGNGFRKEIMDNFQGFATNSSFIYVERTSEPFKGFRKGRFWKIHNRDVALIKDRVPAVQHISPMLFSYGSVVRGNKIESYESAGIVPEYFIIQEMEVLYGRLINEMDLQLRRKVCVIGEMVYETLFNIGEDPVGQNIKVGSTYYQVVGMIRPKARGISIGSNPRRSVYMPLTTLQQLLTGWSNSFPIMGLTLKPGYRMEASEAQVKDLLRELHDIAPTDEKAVGSFNVEKEFQKIHTLFSSLNILIWIVGLGALFSGIIGISNIMLVTVRERMREIGVRRAIGAKPFAIVGQILSESLVLTSLAGMAGFIVGVLILFAAQAIMGQNPNPEGLTMTPYISFSLALTAMGILIASGLLAGLMPALRAMQIKAIDAIRDE